MNWTYFDERTPDDGQLIIVANLKGARQFWLWQASHDTQTMKVLEMDFWCPVPDLPNPPAPPDPFEEYWKDCSKKRGYDSHLHRAIAQQAWDAAMKVKK